MGTPKSKLAVIYAPEFIVTVGGMEKTYTNPASVAESSVTNHSMEHPPEIGRHFFMICASTPQFCCL